MASANGTPETHAEWTRYESSVEDLLAIQEFFEELGAVKQGMERARVIEETDTRNERVLPGVELELDVAESAGSAFLSWDAPACPMADAFSQVAA